ncbi:LADA_0B09846g1_1 [Lachancea dasiensis]|uniref:RING-type E3 ubiquitin transferase n=1 Tax=Lachancea dasiensis TaxID=1072105 RepID=A0A1G4IV04_9SACH|nr:LADA_0B09846g1_1 [Lachancea dasiensis]
MTAGIRRSQFAAYTVVTYLGAIWSVFTCVQCSMSFLEASIKLCQGVNLIIVANFVLINTILLWKGLTKLLFGELRLLEYEHIIERLSFTIVNSFFITSSFPDNEFLTVLAFTGVLIFVKAFHWVLKDRLEYVFQSTDEHTNIFGLICSKFVVNVFLLTFVDYKFIKFCYGGSASSIARSTMYLLFGTEFAVLLVDVLEVAMRTIINLTELYQFQCAYAQDGDDSTGLEGKFIYEKIVELICRISKLCVHAVLLTPSIIPFMVIKDIVLDIFSIYQTGRLIWKTLKNNRQLDEKLPDVSEDELRLLNDKMCIVCMEDLNFLHAEHATTHKLKAKRLPCNHILHLGCLKSWMERSQTCPICRVSVFDEKGNVARSTHRFSESQAAIPTENRDLPVSPTVNLTENLTPSTMHTSSTSYAAATSLRWYACPILPGSTANRVKFKMADSDGKELVVTLTHKKKIGIDERKEYFPNSRKIVIREESLERSYEVDRMKRRISDLESRVQELTKKARTE